MWEKIKEFCKENKDLWPGEIIFATILSIIIFFGSYFFEFFIGIINKYNVIIFIFFGILLFLFFILISLYIKNIDKKKIETVIKEGKINDIDKNLIDYYKQEIDYNFKLFQMLAILVALLSYFLNFFLKKIIENIDNIAEGIGILGIIVSALGFIILWVKMYKLHKKILNLYENKE